MRGRAVAIRELLFALPVLRAPRRSRSAIERRALQGIKELFAYARSDVPYYAGPAYDVVIESIDDLAKLPLLQKDTIRAVDPALLHGPWPGWFQEDLTSGTTGRVVKIRHDSVAYGYHGATIMRRFFTSGYRPWWTIVQIKPFPRPVRWFQKLGIFRRTVVHAGLPETELKDEVLRLRPNVLMGYPVMLRGLLRTLSDSEMARLRRSLRLVFTDSELVTEPVRAMLAERFGVPVCDEYSAYEVLTVGSHCRFGQMHVDEDRVVLELVDDDGTPVPDGEEGAVVVTHYRERAMPLLRYWLGDRAIGLPPECRCGSNFRRMVLTQGRSEDFVVLPNGRRIYIGAILALGLVVPGVSEFMVRQDESGEVTIHLVVDPHAGLGFDEVADNIRTMMNDHLGFDIGLRVVPIDKVTISPGGKARLIESRFQAAAGSEARGA